MKVAVIGLGYLGYVFNEVDPDYEIVGCFDPAPAGMATLKEHGIHAGTSYASP